MKVNKILRLAAAFGLVGVLIVGSAWGYGDQDGRRAKGGHDRSRPENGLQLTDAQKEAIKDLKISFTKEMTPVKNQLDIKMAELKAASTGDNVNTKTVNKLLDEIGDLKTEMAKKRFANKLKVRSLLTDEQKVMFDANAGKGHRGGHGKAMRQGRSGRGGDARQGGDRKGMKRQGFKGPRSGDAEAEADRDLDMNTQG